MKTPWMPTAAGVLDIVSGVVRLVAVLGLVITMIAAGDFLVFTGLGDWYPLNVTTFLWVITVPVAVTGVLAVIGGVFALQRRKWGLALAGSIAAFLPFGILGIAAIVLTALARDDFKD